MRTKNRTNKPLKESALCETFAACAFVRVGTLLGRCWDVAGTLQRLGPEKKMGKLNRQNMCVENVRTNALKRSGACKGK